MTAHAFAGRPVPTSRERQARLVHLRDLLGLRNRFLALGTNTATLRALETEIADEQHRIAHLDPAAAPPFSPPASAPLTAAQCEHAIIGGGIGLGQGLICSIFRL
jgi:hypothetical protein